MFPNFLSSGFSFLHRAPFVVLVAFLLVMLAGLTYSDFVRVTAINFNTGENYILSAVIDSSNQFAYFGTETSPGRVVKVNLSNFQRVGSITFNTGEDVPWSAVIDSSNQFAYFGTLTSPGRVVKVNLSNFQRVGNITFNTGENNLYSAAIDLSNQFAYFGTETSPGRVVKVNLSNFQRVGSITFNTGEDNLYSAAIDSSNQFAYFGTGNSPGMVVKVNLTNFQRVGNITFNTDENKSRSAVIDTANQFAYFGTLTTPGRVVKVNLSNFQRVGNITFNTGENSLRSAVIDSSNQFAYFGTYTIPGRVVKVNLNTSDTTPPVITLQSPANTTYTTFSMDLNYTVSDDTGVSQCKYELNGGANVSLATCQNTTFTAIEGSNSIKVWANDTANNWGVSSMVSFTVDTTAPTVSIQLPANTTYSSTSRTLNFTAGDSNGISSCKYELNGAANVTLAGCANTSFTAVSGSNTIRVYVNDTANNWNSSMVSFTVDNTPPVITIQAPTNQTYGTVSVDLNYTVSDDLGVSQCKYELNGVNTSLSTCANATITAAVGNNTVKVWANDTANNWGVSSTVAFKVDTVFPVWTLNNFPKSDNSTVVNSSIAWDARVSDANLYRILLNVTSAANGSSVYSLYESDWNLTEYNFTGTTDTSGWAEGKYIAEFSATDDHTFGGLRGLNYTVDGYKMFFGNGKTNYSFAFQTKNPNGSIMPLEMSADLSTLVSYNSTRKEYKWGYALKLPNPSFRATVFLNSSTDRIVLRNASMAHFVIEEFYVDFKDVLQAGYLLNVSNGSGGYFIDIWKESYGVSPNSLITIDPVSGGTNTQTEFYSFNVDHTSPSISLNSPVNASWLNNATPLFNLTVSDNIAASGSCNLTVDAVRMAAGTWTNNTPFTMSNTTALTAGTHYWNATCVDSAGNLKTSQTFAVSIDTVNPNVVCISCPVSSSTSSLTFSVTATDALSGVNVSRLFYRGAYYTMSKSGDTYSYSLTENNNGEYSYQFFVNDTAGNLNSTVTGSVVVGASTSSPPPAGGGGGGGGGEALTVADLLDKLRNLTQAKPDFPGENLSYISRPAADVTKLNLSALVFDYSKLGDPYYILPSSSPIQQYVSNFPKWSVLVPISAITGLISTAAFGGGWGGAVWVIATYFEGYWIADLNTWVNVNGTLVALNATVGG